MQEKESIMCCSVSEEIQPLCKLFAGTRQSLVTA